MKQENYYNIDISLYFVYFLHIYRRTDKNVQSFFNIDFN